MESCPVQTDDWCAAIEESLRRGFEAEMERQRNELHELKSKHETLQSQHEHMVKGMY